MKNKSVLKELINSAKERLKNRDYGTSTYNYISKQNDKAKTNHLLRILANQEFKRPDIIIKTLSTKEDEIFAQKVVNLLEHNPNSMTPLAELIDVEIFKNLNDTEKQNYILTLSERYLKIKEEYNKKRNSI